MGAYRKMLFYKDKLLVLASGVYEPNRYTFFFEEHIDVRAGDVVLDLVTGSGFFPVVLAETASRIVGIDINKSCVDNARMNAALNGYEEKIDIRLGSLFEPVPRDEKYDLIIANPPEFPTPPEKERDDWFGLASLAGRDGRKVIEGILPKLQDYLKPGGRFQMWHAWYANIPKTLQQLEDLGFETELTAEKYFSVGFLSFERATYLETIGFPLLNLDGKLMQHHAIITAKNRN